MRTNTGRPIQLCTLMVALRARKKHGRGQERRSGPQIATLSGNVGQGLP